MSLAFAFLYHTPDQYLARFKRGLSNTRRPLVLSRASVIPCREFPMKHRDTESTEGSPYALKS